MASVYKNCIRFHSSMSCFDLMSEFNMRLMFLIKVEMFPHMRRAVF